MNVATLDEARRIFGGDLLGYAEIAEALRSDPCDALSPAERAAIDRLPFSSDLLVGAANDGMMLVLRIPRVSNDADLTILDFTSRLPGAGRLVTAPQTAWFAREPFAAEETCRLGWALVDKQPRPETQNLSYAEQDEVVGRRSERLGFALRRRTAVEIVYDTLLYAASRGEHLLAKEWDWSSSQTTDDALVTVGEFGDEGLRLLGYSQAVRFYGLGVCATLDAAGNAR